MKALICAPAIGAVGDGKLGGVNVTLDNIVSVLKSAGIKTTVVAGKGSLIARDDVELITLSGAFQKACQHQPRTTKQAIEKNSLLKNQWSYIESVQDQFQYIINMSYDCLPLRLTASFKTPVFHVISMQSMNDEIDALVRHVNHY